MGDVESQYSVRNLDFKNNYIKDVPVRYLAGASFYVEAGWSLWGRYVEFRVGLYVVLCSVLFELHVAFILFHTIFYNVFDETFKRPIYKLHVFIELTPQSSDDR